MSDFLKAPVETARRVLEKFNIGSAPVDVRHICALLNIKVVNVDFLEIEMDVGKKIAGAIQKNPGDVYTIFVNDYDPEPRARFTIAHELGHYFLDLKDDKHSFITSFRMDRSPRETAANKFATELLMPTKLVMEEHAKMVIPVSDSLAEIFNVSRQAMRIQLDSLGLIYV